MFSVIILKLWKIRDVTFIWWPTVTNIKVQSFLSSFNIIFKVFIKLLFFFCLWTQIIRVYWFYNFAIYQIFYHFYRGFLSLWWTIFTHLVQKFHISFNLNWFLNSMSRTFFYYQSYSSSWTLVFFVLQIILKRKTLSFMLSKTIFKLWTTSHIV